ncbi:hydantoinase/oxoprolinase N-terminal domain-containing protein [Pseudonocardia benzenivorans]
MVHGHTAGINAVLSRQGSSVALLATEGHRDLLDIGRMDREFGPNFYDPTRLRPHQERPVARRRHRYGIRERIGWDGAEVVALDEDQVREVAGRIRDAGIESVAICFLNSYLNQSHEQRAARILREELPGSTSRPRRSIRSPRSTSARSPSRSTPTSGPSSRPTSTAWRVRWPRPASAAPCG